MRHGGPVTPMPRDPMMQRSQQLTVGATPADGRYDQYDPNQPHVPDTSPGEHSDNGGNYYMQHQAAMSPELGFNAEYERSFGPQPGPAGVGSPMYQNQDYQQYDQDPSEDKYHTHHPDSPYSPQRVAMQQGDFSYPHEDDRINDLHEQGAYIDDNAAPDDEAMHHRHQRMDPPEDSPRNKEMNDSIAESGHNSESYYNDQETGPYGEHSADDYVYSHSTREGQYYDSPEGIKDQPGSQDHEFFNAHSGEGDAEDGAMGIDPDTVVSSFDPQGHLGRHPDDQFINGEYYEEEVDGDIQDEQQSPLPINADHLRRLGQNPQPKSPRAMASPMSAASSQNSGSEYSHSSAMRGAQELLRRNRLRRQQQ